MSFNIVAKRDSNFCEVCHHGLYDLDHAECIAIALQELREIEEKEASKDNKKLLRVEVQKVQSEAWKVFCKRVVEFDLMRTDQIEGMSNGQINAMIQLVIERIKSQSKSVFFVCVFFFVFSTCLMCLLTYAIFDPDDFLSFLLSILFLVILLFIALFCCMVTCLSYSLRDTETSALNSLRRKGS